MSLVERLEKESNDIRSVHQIRGADLIVWHRTMAEAAARIRELEAQVANAGKVASLRPSRAEDIILEAIAAYDGYMLDDDYNAQGCLDKIIKQMQERLGYTAIKESK